MASERPVVSPPLDRYVVLEYLAEGGMGAIYKGKKLGAGGFEKEVVLKQLLPEFTSQPEFIDLFLREARLTATLQHANIVHTIDLVNAGEEYFIVMEYVRGGDLRTLLKRAKRRKRRVDPRAALFIAREVLAALGYAHQKRGEDGKALGIIHRDVSPSNILVSGTGEVKLTDFGIAKASTHRSIFYRVKGKVGYMSPEQAHGETLDHRSDLYSLAVCLYEMLTGERLFVSAGITTSADEIYKQPVPAVSKKRPELPKELDKLMWKALAVNRDERYQSAGEFSEALARAAHRTQLNCSASDLSRLMNEACGDVPDWHSTQVADIPRGDGFGHEGTDQIRPSELLENPAPGFDARATGTAVLDEDELDDEFDSDISDVSDVLDDESGSADDADGEWARMAKGMTGTSSTSTGATGTGTRMRGGSRKRKEPEDISRLHGMELTSIIPFGQELTHAGAKPLVDFTGPQATAAPRPPLPLIAEDTQGPQPNLAAPAPPVLPRSKMAEAPRKPDPVPVLPKRPSTAAAPVPFQPPQNKPTKDIRPPKKQAPAEKDKKVEPPLAAEGKKADRDKKDPRAPTTARLPPEERRLRAWVPIALLVVGGVGIAYAIAVSGPEIKAPPATAAPQLPPPAPPPPTVATRKLTVTSEPSGARVTVDGQDRGCKTPCTLDDLSPTSTVVLRLDRDGYLPWSGLVAAKGEVTERKAILRAAPRDPSKLGQVLFRTSAPAEVLLGERELGHVTTAGPLSLMPGSARLTLRSEDGETKLVQVDVAAGQLREVSVELK